MGKKLIKWILWILLGIMGLLLLISILIYLPPVQAFIKNRASSIVYNSTGMNLSIDRFRLRFPLSVSIDNTILVTPEGDTLLRAGRIGADVALWPLFAGRVQVRQAGLEKVGVHYTDTLSALAFTASLDEFKLGTTSITLKDNDIQISGADLRRADVALWMGESHKPDTAQADTIPVLWKIRLDRLDIDRLDFRMHTAPEVTELTVGLPSGRIDDVLFDMEEQDIRVGLIRLQQGKYAYLADTATRAATPPVPEKDSLAATGPDPAAAGSQAEWKIRVNRLELADNAVKYGVLNGEAQPGFDSDHIELEGVNVRVDEIRFAGNDLGAEIRQLEARERSGFEILQTHGNFSMDSARMRLDEFNLRTAHSSVSADAEISAGLLKQDPHAPLSAKLSAELSPDDLYYFHAPDSALRRTLAGRSLRLDGDFSGTLSQLRIHTLSARMPGHIDFRADGQVANLLEPDRLGGNIRLNGTFTDLGFVSPMLPDSLRGRIGFPERMALNGTLKMSGDIYEPDLRLTVDSSGVAGVKALVDLRREIYDAEVEITDFPLYAFLPQDTLGLLSMNLTARGEGFDPRRDGAKADIDFTLGQFGFKQYTYRDIALKAILADHLVNGGLTGSDPSVQLAFGLTGELYPERYRARLNGRIDTLDLYRTGFMPEAFQAGLLLNAAVEGYTDSTFRADVAIDSVRLLHGFHTHQVRHLSLNAQAAPKRVTAAVRSGDLTLDFNAPVPLDSLLAGLAQVSDRVMEQVGTRRLDMEQIQQNLPPFRLEASAGRDNMLYSMLKTEGMDFRSMELTATTMGDRPLRAGMVIHSLKTAGLTLDTLNVGLIRRDRQLNYFVRLANRPGNFDDLALIALAGHAVDNRATLNVYQRNRRDSVGFRFGFAAELLDSAVQVRVTPENPRFAYQPWSVNPDNYLIYHFDKSLKADIRLEGPDPGQHVYITSRAFPPVLPDGAVKLDMKGIRIAPMLELYPSAPDIGGTLNTDVGFGYNHDKMITLGNVEVKDLTYDKKRVGDIAVGVALSYDNLENLILKGRAQIDGETVLRADGTYLGAEGEGGMSIRIDIPTFPLSSANAFLPEEMARLSGELNGWVTLAGAGPVFDGELRFADAKLEMPVTGTAYRFSDRPILIRKSVLDVNRFGLISPNNQNLTIRGTVDFTDMSRMMADLSLNARDFDAVNSTRRGGSPLYGKAPIDLNLTAKGPVNTLTVRGNLKLRRGTDITYTVQEGHLHVDDVKQDIVTFVDFSDPDTFEPADSTLTKPVFGMDLQVSINIEENIQTTVNITRDGNSRAELAGNGDLTYTMNVQGDSRFMGRFNVASGLIVYSPPVIDPRDFKINPDSYVEWTGELMNPVLNLTASDAMRISVTDEDTDRPSRRTVNFVVSILVRNALENMDLLFDLAAPNDARIGPELATMTQEQRSQKAMEMLIFNTYTGPGTRGSADLVGNPLNSFISKELNQWARNSLPGIDLSVGLDTVEEDGGGQHTSYSYQVSKSFMNDRVRVSIGGNIDPEASGDNVKNNFVDDISLEYRLTERDNMYLKGFRYTTQDMLEGEIVETGVGFLYRKKMNKFKDLFKLTPKRRSRSGEGGGRNREGEPGAYRGRSGQERPENGQPEVSPGSGRRERQEGAPGERPRTGQQQPVVKQEETSGTPEPLQQPEKTPQE